jgi:hypothetical protein
VNELTKPKQIEKEKISTAALCTWNEIHDSEKAKYKCGPDGHSRSS